MTTTQGDLFGHKNPIRSSRQAGTNLLEALGSGLPLEGELRLLWRWGRLQATVVVEAEGMRGRDVVGASAAMKTVRLSESRRRVTWRLHVLKSDVPVLVAGLREP